MTISNEFYKTKDAFFTVSFYLEFFGNILNKVLGNSFPKARSLLEKWTLPYAITQF